jgi:hypothetical protein
VRPRGEVRMALMQAVERLVAVQGAVTWRQAAEAAQVGYEAARRTMDNMARAGELKIVGSDKPAGSTQWQSLFEPNDADTPQAWGGIEALASVMRTFPTTAE